ncbi:MAG: DUF6132 family protein [Rikenellaceae bacterium]|jgi:hypothetical protein|nr:DUF6132 family protein [Rikenellaceae bacterium]
MREKIITLFKREWITIAGVIAGAIGGYLYWFFIGCNSGSCPITSSPLNSTLYGIVLGALFFSLFKKKNQNEDNHKS